MSRRFFKVTARVITIQSRSGAVIHTAPDRARVWIIGDGDDCRYPIAVVRCSLEREGPRFNPYCVFADGHVEPWLRDYKLRGEP